MNIVVVAADEQYQALVAGNTGIRWVKAAADFTFSQYAGADAFFIVQPQAVYNYNETAAPVFLNSVVATLQELQAPPHVVRVNGWPGFLQRPVWEIAGHVDERITAIAASLQKKIITVKDEPGLVAAKIIAMIINEAYFAVGDAVSSKNEIDIAMKLGTNYPYGPFEWAEKIGLENIFSLLQKLSAADQRYAPAPALATAIQH